MEALRANGQEEFQVTELEMIPQTEVTLEGEDLEVFEGLIDALEADDDVQKGISQRSRYVISFSTFRHKESVFMWSV